MALRSIGILANPTGAVVRVGQGGPSQRRAVTGPVDSSTPESTSEDLALLSNERSRLDEDATFLV